MDNYTKTIRNIENLIMRDYSLIGKNMKESENVSQYTGMISERRCGYVGISIFAERLNGELTIEFFLGYCPEEYVCQTAEYMNRINNMLDNGIFKIKSNGSIEYKVKAYFKKGELTEEEIDEIMMKSIIIIRREKRSIGKLASGRALMPGDYKFSIDYMDDIKLPLSFLPDIKMPGIKSLKDLKIRPVEEEFKSFEEDYAKIIEGEENDGFKDDEEIEKDDFEPFANLEGLYNENKDDNFCGDENDEKEQGGNEIE